MTPESEDTLLKILDAQIETNRLLRGSVTVLEHRITELEQSRTELERRIIDLEGRD